MNAITAIFVGPQGSGKGTQVELLKKYLSEHDERRAIFHYDSGSTLRAFRDGQGYTQGLVRESMARGEIQPDFLATMLVGDAFVKAMTGNEHVLVDGYPRTVPQAHTFDEVLNFYKREQPTIINITLSEEVAIERMLKRGRHDDTEDGIRNRLAWFTKHVLPTLEYFRTHERYRVVDIDGDQAIEAVHQDIISTFARN